MELSSQRDRFKLPHLLIAKALLHLCGRAFEEVYRDSEENEDDSVKLFSEEYYMIQDHFIDFYGQTNVNNRAADYIFYYLRKDIDMEMTLEETETGLSNLCDEVCPMCGSPCDNIMESHSVHSSFLHRPRGMKGEAYSETSKLVLEDCNSSLLLRNATFTVGNETLPCAMYKRRFPNWDIRPTNGDFGKRFWQWLFATQNDWIALTFDSNLLIYSKLVSHKRARSAESLEQDKNLKTKGRSTFHGGVHLINHVRS
ncbi:hypothetical protein BSL78_27058 [Apostichopus japonicus]|uniref:Uncharacterized protein n=1 Tax=Stichopus japonicus TaxID=307972 RepID=A0A2G8JK57_STIJA|nr:hypothetical protein BSL78_27058 [Apostichopus japonicus]